MGKRIRHKTTHKNRRNHTRPRLLNRFLHALIPRRSVFKKSYVQLRRQRKRLTNVGTAALILTSTILPLVDFGNAQAATSVLLPDTDVTTGWTLCNNTTCGAALNTYVDEDASGTYTGTDYINTGPTGSSAADAAVEFGVTSAANVDTVSSITVYVYAYSATNANGGTLDDITIDLRIGGSLQGAITRTPAYSAGGTYSQYSAVFTGSWSQANLDGAQVLVTRVTQGSGNPTNQRDDVRIGSLSATAVYTQTVTFDQSSYRWFENEDTSSEITFARSNDSTTGTIRSVVQTMDGGYAVLHAGLGTKFSKYSTVGILEWSKYWDSTGLAYTYDLIQTADGGYAITGRSVEYNPGGGSYDMVFMKANSDGSIAWNRTWGGSGEETGYSIIQTANGDYAITGETNSFSGNSDMFIVTYGSDGTISWSRTWGSTGVDIGHSIIQTSDGGYAVTGHTKSYGDTTNGDMFLAKYASDGTLSWSRTWGGSGVESIATLYLLNKNLIQTSDGGYAVTGHTKSYGDTTNGDMFLAKYTSDGTLSWSRTWGGSGIDWASSIAQAADGGFVVAGSTRSFGAGSDDTFVAKYDSTGEYSWSRTFGSSNEDKGTSVTTAADGGFVVVGSYDNSQGLLIKYNSSGSIAGCGSPMCQSPTATTSSPTATTSSPTATTSSPTATTSSPTEVTINSASTSSTLVALGPTIDVGDPLAALNTAANAPSEGTPFRLRMNLHVNDGQADPGSATFKLQYAARGADNVCDTAFSGETYADLSPNTGPIRFYNNTNAVDGQPLATNANDPTHSTDDLVRQSYEESNNFTVVNAIPAGDDGMWDFALVDAVAPASTTYCFRAVNSTGTVLNSYAVVPQITTASSTLSQASFRAYENGGATGAESFVKAWGGTGSVIDIGRSLAQTSDGGYAVTGETFSFGAGGYDMFLAKYASDGTLSWSHTWGGTGNDYGRSLAQTTDGGYAVTGQTASYGAGGSDMFLAKYDSAGSVSWSRTWGGTGTDTGYSLVQTTDGGYVVTGETASYGAGGSDMFLAKYDSAGSLSWSRTWGGTGTDTGYSLVQTTDGGYVVTGRTNSYGAGSTDVFLAKYTSDGTLSWSRTWGGTGIDNGYSLVQTTDGGYVVTGETGSYGAGSGDMFLVIYDSSGSLSWSRTWGGSSYDRGNSLIQTDDGGYAVTGETSSYGAGSKDMFLAKYDSSGKIAGCSTTMCQSPTATVEVDGVDYTSVTEVDGVDYTSVTEVDGVDYTSTTRVDGVDYTSVVEVDGVDYTSTNTTIVGPPATFAKAWGGTNNDYGYSTVQTSDGGYAVTGHTKNFVTDTTNGDMFLAKYNSDGTISWSRTWGGTGADYGYSLIQASDGSYVVAGYTDSFGAGNADMFLAKYSSTGTFSWSRTWGGSGIDEGYSLIETSDGGYAVTGRTYSFAGNADMFLAKYTSGGTLSWSRTWGGIFGTGSEAGNSLIQTADGGFAVAGTYISSTGLSGMLFLVKYTSDGTYSWSRTLGGGSTGVYQAANSVIQTSDEGYIIAGSTSPVYGAGGIDMLLVKYTSGGTLSWSRTWGGTGDESGAAILAQADGSFVVAGNTNSYGAGGYDIFITKYTSGGTLSWSRTWGGTGDDYISRSSVQNSDVGYVAAGYTTSYGSGNNDMFLAKFDGYGDIWGCGSTNCTSPAVYIDSPQITTNLPSPTTDSPTATVNVDGTNYTSTRTSPTVTLTNIFTATPITYLQNGTALAAMDTRAELLETDMDFRLRIGLQASGKKYTGTGTFKIQSGVYTGTCDPASTSYTDVSSATSPIAFYDNSFAATADKVHPDATNPVVTGTRETMQTYIEANTFANPRQMDVNDTGIWDFSLKADGAKIGRTYCFRIVESGASLNGGYSQYAEVYIPPTMGNVMRHGKFFNTQGTQQPFAWGRE